ncbi:MAG TPA: response regulator [Candidatus Dormibacteraeota bacterium]|nr:response regulator [Candidatus Dormibacteraeota bacterium]
MATVVVVDDSAPDRQLVASLLKYAGHEVMLCADGHAGLDLIKKVKPDLVITDLITPGIDGYELARAVRMDLGTTATPIMLQTAHYLESEVRRIAARIGIQQVIIKPFEPQAFLDAVAKTLRDKAVVPLDTVAIPGSEFHVEHLRLVSAKLHDKVMELEATRRELDRTAAKYQLLFMAQPEATWVFDLGTLRFMEVNDAAIRRYGYSRDDFLAMTIKDINAPQEGPSPPAILYSERSGPRLHRKKDGSVIKVWILTQDVNYCGQRSRYVMAQDLIERRRMQPQVNQGQRTET